MKNKSKLIALSLAVVFSLMPVIACTVCAEDTTDLIESTDTPSGKDTDPADSGLLGDLTGDAEDTSGKDKDTDTENGTGGVVSDAESILDEMDRDDGNNISTGDDGTIDKTPENPEKETISTWVIIVAIIIVAAVIILICALMPKKRD